VVILKDLILGAQIARNATLEEWKDRPAQVEVARADLVLHVVAAAPLAVPCADVTDAAHAADAAGAAGASEPRLLPPGFPTDSENADGHALAEVRARLGPAVPLLTVVNKIDLAGLAAGRLADRVQVSALTGAGMDALRGELLHAAGWGPHTRGEDVVLARERHLDALRRAAGHLAAAARHADPQATSLPLELFAEELRLAGDALGGITGAVHADALLGRIFGQFCIGK